MILTVAAKFILVQLMFSSYKTGLMAPSKSYAPSSPDFGNSPVAVMIAKNNNNIVIRANFMFQIFRTVHYAV